MSRPNAMPAFSLSRPGHMEIVNVVDGSGNPYIIAKIEAKGDDGHPAISYTCVVTEREVVMDGLLTIRMPDLLRDST